MAALGESPDLVMASFSRREETFFQKSYQQLLIDLGNIEPRLRGLIDSVSIERNPDWAIATEQIREGMYPSCDGELFRVIRSFSHWIDFAGFAMRPGQQWEHAERYRDGRSPTLSEMLDSKLAVCLELAAAGHHYLSVKGIDLSYDRSSGLRRPRRSSYPRPPDPTHSGSCNGRAGM